ncbi:glycosyltransferase family 4 protein [Nesterenkonia populi]|uniref:glycosyltransferase family 4 protein n=1 Tax=Nesterenkonia populi TaxID=1591087 RepID=UPI0011BE4119|nr:glycosyltransferase family 4 protein [Nesterenkonia populi]
MPKPRVRFQIQPTVSHYREPLIRQLLRSGRLAMEVVGRFSNSEAGEAERIESASEDVLRRAAPVRTLSVGQWWWQVGDAAAVWRGGYDAYVLEGRFYTVSAWAAGAVGKLRGRRVFLWGHGWKRPEAGAKRLTRLMLYRLADGLLVYGDRAKELGVEYGVPAEKIQVVYNSLYSECALAEPEEPTGEDTDPPTLIYSSRLTARHRLDSLAEALAHWPENRPRPRVIVVGDGSERPRLERLFAEKQVKAEFLGAVYDYDRLRQLYAQADLALSVGGAGLNVIQALSFGVPVVAEAGSPDSSPEIEAVVEGETGRYYDGTASHLRTVLAETLSDRVRLRELGRRGVGLVRGRYTAERHAEAIEEGILRLISDR